MQVSYSVGAGQDEQIVVPRQRLCVAGEACAAEVVLGDPVGLDLAATCTVEHEDTFGGRSEEQVGAHAVTSESRSQTAKASSARLSV